MEIKIKGQIISISKELTVYDDLAISFSKILQKQNINHVFVSGYIAILFGRSRISEDVDVLVEKIQYDGFLPLWKALNKKFYCHNAGDAGIAYRDYLERGIAIRFSEKGVVIPNMEFKWVSTEQHARALADRFTAVVSGKPIPISPIEMQIAYKLYLGSEKDVEDARYLFELFRERLDMKRLMKEIAYMKVPTARAKENLGW